MNIRSVRCKKGINWEQQARNIQEWKEATVLLQWSQSSQSAWDMKTIKFRNASFFVLTCVLLFGLSRSQTYFQIFNSNVLGGLPNHYSFSLLTHIEYELTFGLFTCDFDCLLPRYLFTRASIPFRLTRFLASHVIWFFT